MTQKFYQVLIDQKRPVGERYFGVFQLKNIGTDQAVKCMMSAYPHCGQSVLLKHQLLYALGQLPEEKYPLIKQFLIEKMSDQGESNLSRHQAAEALANYFDQDIMKYYEKYQKSQCKQLRDTCLIALQKLRNKDLKQKYGHEYNRTMQPAAPFSQQQLSSFLTQHNLESAPYLAILQSPIPTLFQKYRIMYYLRNKNTKECIETLCNMLSLKHYKNQCSLLKHEICFILGQIGIQGFEGLIRECVENEDQEDIVRHEALAAVASQSKDVGYLTRFLDGKYSRLIRESAEVAIYTIKYWGE